MRGGGDIVTALTAHVALDTAEAHIAGAAVLILKGLGEDGGVVAHILP